MRKPCPKPTRPMEYIAIFILNVPTEECDAWVIMGYDPFSDLLMDLAVETSLDVDILLKALFYLTEQPLFREHSSGPFFVLLDSFKNEQERIDKMLAHSGGKSMYHLPYHEKLIQKVMKTFSTLYGQEPED